jgi:hypothetical protein
MRLFKGIMIVLLGAGASVLVIGGGNLAAGVDGRPEPFIAYPAILIGTECWALLFIWATRQRLRAVQFALTVLIMWPAAIAGLSRVSSGSPEPHASFFLGTIAVTLLLNLVVYKRFFGNSSSLGPAKN